MYGWIGAAIGAALGLIETGILLPRMMDRITREKADKSPISRAALWISRVVFLAFNVIFGALMGYTVGLLIGG